MVPGRQSGATLAEQGFGRERMVAEIPQTGPSPGPMVDIRVGIRHRHALPAASRSAPSRARQIRVVNPERLHSKNVKVRTRREPGPLSRDRRRARCRPTCAGPRARSVLAYFRVENDPSVIVWLLLASIASTSMLYSVSRFRNWLGTVTLVWSPGTVTLNSCGDSPAFASNTSTW